VKVITPAMEVTKVEARAAGATSAAGRPAPIRTGERIEPPQGDAEEVCAGKALLAVSCRWLGRFDLDFGAGECRGTAEVGEQER
jgi:hypothetical protein